MDSSGNSRFSKQLFEPSKLEIFNTPLSLGNNVIFSSSDGNLSILDSLGNILYNHKYNSSILDYISAIDDENILITLSNNKFGVTDTLVCLSSKGIENGDSPLMVSDLSKEQSPMGLRFLFLVHCKEVTTRSQKFSI